MKKLIILTLALTSFNSWGLVFNKVYKGQSVLSPGSACTAKIYKDGSTVKVEISRDHKKAKNVGSELQMSQVEGMFKQLRYSNDYISRQEIRVKSAAFFGGETVLSFEYKRLENGGQKLISLEVDGVTHRSYCEFYN